MATKKSAGLSGPEVKKAVNNLQTSLNALGNSLKNLNTHLETLGTGADGVAYWSGPNAYAWFKNVRITETKMQMLLTNMTNTQATLSVAADFMKKK